MGRIADNLALIRDRIAAVCQASGRSADEITLVAVSKRIDLDLLLEACRAGQRIFGENRIQDALPRQSALRKLLDDNGMRDFEPDWHFIGHLQTNKANKAVGRFSLIHSIDSLDVSRRLVDRCNADGSAQNVLVEINAGAEPQKNGLLLDGALDTVLAMADILGPSLRGLMAMSRFGADDRELARTFSSVRRLAEDVRRRSGLPLPVLSMGMSGDYEAAIAEGATHVRIGTAIFGSRTP